MKTYRVETSERVNYLVEAEWVRIDGDFIVFLASENKGFCPSQPVAIFYKPISIEDVSA